VNPTREQIADMLIPYMRDSERYAMADAILALTSQEESVPVGKCPNHASGDHRLYDGVNCICGWKLPAKTDKCICSTPAPDCKLCNGSGLKEGGCFSEGNTSSPSTPDTPSEKDGIDEIIEDSKLYQGFQGNNYIIRFGLKNDLAQAIHKYISDRLPKEKTMTMSLMRERTVSIETNIYNRGYNQALKDIRQALGLTGGKE
jgi:hypothetical protein